MSDCENFGFRVDTHALSDCGLERIFDYASRLYSDRNCTSLNDMWGGIIGPNHASFVESCVNRNKIEFTNMTRVIAQTPLVLGFMNYNHYLELVRIPQARKAESIQFVDKLLSLAEYLCVTLCHEPRTRWVACN